MTGGRNFTNIKIFYGNLFRRTRQMNRGHDKNQFVQNRILTELLSRTALTQELLRKKIRAEESLLSETLTQLERRGLLKWNKCPADRGKDILTLTPAGKEIAERYKRHRERFARQFETLSEEEREQFGALFDKIHAHNRGEEFSHFHYRGRHFGIDEDDSGTDGGGDKR